MSFEVAGSAYGQFMGRYSEPLAEQFLQLVRPAPGQRALDVGCGPGALTAALAARLGVPAVAAIDPSEQFVAAVRDRLPGIEVRTGVAEQLPYPDGQFDLALSQLVVHFMPDPVAGLAEMARVTRDGGLVAACTWDHAGEHGPLATFSRAARELDPSALDEGSLPGSRQGQLEQLFDAAGLAEVQASTLRVEVAFAGFDQWWQPYTLGVGPAGDHVAALDPAGRERLRARCAQLLPDGPFVQTAAAWVALGRA